MVTESSDNVSANTITRTYDALNRVTSYTDAEGNTIKYSYDEFGNIVSITYPEGQKVAKNSKYCQHPTNTQNPAKQRERGHICASGVVTHTSIYYRIIVI